MQRPDGLSGKQRKFSIAKNGFRQIKISTGLFLSKLSLRSVLYCPPSTILLMQSQEMCVSTSGRAALQECSTLQGISAKTGCLQQISEHARSRSVLGPCCERALKTSTFMCRPVMLGELVAGFPAKTQLHKCWPESLQAYHTR